MYQVRYSDTLKQLLHPIKLKTRYKNNSDRSAPFHTDTVLRNYLLFFSAINSIQRLPISEPDFYFSQALCEWSPRKNLVTFLELLAKGESFFFLVHVLNLLGIMRGPYNPQQYLKCLLLSNF